MMFIRWLTFCACAGPTFAGDISPFEMSVEAGGWRKDRVASPSQEVEMSFWVKETHLNKLKNVLAKVSDPSNPMYGHYLSKSEVDALTAPTEHDVKVVEEALRPYKVQHKGGSSILIATVPVSFAEKVFGGQFVYYCRKHAEEPECVMRNPTSTIPLVLKAACDIITPLNDPLPPKLQGPIRVSPSPVEVVERSDADKLSESLRHRDNQPVGGIVDTVAQIDSSDGGCCASFGYGSMMRPCCLSTRTVVDESACKTGKRMGGATVYKAGTCPASADEAAMLAEGKSSAGCCFSIGFGAEMKPCCLTTNNVSREDECHTAHRMGGATYFHTGQCPSTAEEAAALAKGGPASSKLSLGAVSAMPLQTVQPSKVRQIEAEHAQQSRAPDSSGMPRGLVGFVVVALLVGSVLVYLHGRQEARNAPLLDTLPE